MLVNVRFRFIFHFRRELVYSGVRYFCESSVLSFIHVLDGIEGNITKEIYQSCHTQDKMQCSLLLCIKQCHVVIQAAQYGFQSL